MRTSLAKASSSLPAHVLKDRVIQRLMDAEKALSFAVNVDQVKLVMDAAAAQEVFAKRQKLGEEVIGFAHTIKVRALTRLGELVKIGQEAGAISARGRPFKSSIKEDLSDLGITHKTSALAQELASLASTDREAIERREKTLSQVRRERKAEEVRRVVTLPDAKYRVLYADPPWRYGDTAGDGGVQAHGVAEKYPTMSIAQLCDLPVGSLCEERAVLFLWTTSPILFESAAVFRAWGFAYKASFVWDKVKHNMGHYNSVRHELLLVCTKGSCTPDVTQLFDSVQVIEKTTHSAKPAQFRKIIDTLYPYGKRLELFAREKAEGWDVFGYEADREQAGVA